MASRRLCISASIACDTHPIRKSGPRGGQANRRALDTVGVVGSSHLPCRGGPLAATRGGGGHARQKRVKGTASSLVHSTHGGGTFTINVDASKGWKNWASTLVHVSTGWRIRWVLRHCNQPPPRCQLRGWPHRTYRCWCTQCMGAALAVLVHCRRSPPRYHPGVMGVLLQQHSSCSARTAAILALHPHRSQARSIAQRAALEVPQEPRLGSYPHTADGFPSRVHHSTGRRDKLSSPVNHS